MNIIDYECLACRSLNECGTEVSKGSILCMSKRISNKQTKGEMLQKMFDIAQCGKESADILEMLNIRK